MERKITIISEDGSRDAVTFTSNATTLLELKNELRQQGISYSGKSFYEGISRTEIMTDESILPSNLPYRGTVTNDLVFMLTTPNKKISSGLSRSELYTFIKENNLGNLIKDVYGNNYTNVKTSCLEEFVETYKKGEDSDDFYMPDECKEKEVKDIDTDDKASTFETLVDTLTTLADVLSDVVTLTNTLGVQLGLVNTLKTDDDFESLFKGWIK